jgi:hypothetical protein
MKRLSTARKLCVPWHDRSLSALSSNKLLFPTSPCFLFAPILRYRNFLLGPRYLSYYPARPSRSPTPSLYRIQIA